MHLKADNLSKEYSGKQVVHDISFEARAGYILGILGPEGAGKTAILRMLIDVIRPTSGLIFYDDEPINRKIKNAIGYLPQKRGLYPKYSINKTLVYFARLKNFSRKKAQVEAVRLMDRFNVIEQMDTPISQLDEETTQKVQIMSAIIHNPDLLILDEPFTALTSANQQLIRKLIQHLKEDGKTIVLATKELNAAETVCDEALLINDGMPVLQDSLKRIKQKFRENLIYVASDDDLQGLQEIFGVKRIILEENSARLYIDSQVPTKKILDIIIRSVNVKSLEVHRPNLKDIFVEVMNRNKNGGTQ